MIEREIYREEAELAAAEELARANTITNNMTDAELAALTAAATTNGHAVVPHGVVGAAAPAA